MAQKWQIKDRIIEYENFEAAFGDYAIRGAEWALEEAHSPEIAIEWSRQQVTYYVKSTFGTEWEGTQEQIIQVYDNIRRMSEEAVARVYRGYQL